MPVKKAIVVAISKMINRAEIQSSLVFISRSSRADDRGPRPGNTNMQLSKSQYVRGLQCHKALWLYRHRREVMTATSPQQELIFANGHCIGKLAQELFP